MDQYALGLDPLPKKTLKEVFLDEMSQVVPWETLVALIAPFARGALVGHSHMGIKTCKLPVDRSVKEGFLHGQIRRGELLLHAVNARHAFQGKGWAAVLAFGVIRGNEFNQCSPGNCPIHLGQQLLLARLLGVQAQVKAALLHAREDATTGGVIYQRGARFCRISLEPSRSLSSRA